MTPMIQLPSAVTVVSQTTVHESVDTFATQSGV